MDVTLYKNFSVENTVNKNKTQVAKYTGVQLVEPTDDHDVTIRMAVPTATLRWDKVNYFEWDGAFYFLESNTEVANGVTVINGRMDELETYRAAVLECRGHLVRSSSHGSSRLEDAARVFSVDATKTVSKWPNQIDDTDNGGFYVLLTSQPEYSQDTSA